MRTSPRPLGQLGEYHLLSKIAQGGMGEVFLAKRLGVGGFEKTFAVKRMLDSLSGSEEFVGMFFDEARLAARLSHPNIAQIYDFGFVDGHYYIAMEYIAGEDLSAIITQLLEQHLQAPLPIALRILIEVCHGLEYAHTLAEEGRSLGIIHRDVSPSNILVSYQGAVKLLDFGIAKATSRVSETRPQSLKGKLSFVSPEQIQGLPLDGRADLFSLGIGFYALLTGRHPFRRESEVATMHAITHLDPPDPAQFRPELPGSVSALVRKTLARDREQRYASASDLAAAAQAILSTLAPATGASDLASWVITLFGRERMVRKNTVPTLSQVDLSAVVTPTPAPLPSIPSMPTAARPPRSRWFRGTIRVALAAVLGAAFVLLAGRGRDRQVGQPRPVAESPRISAQPLPPAVPPAPAPPAPPSPKPTAPPPVVRPARASLEPLDLQRLHAVVRRARQRFATCFRTHAAQLPGASGEVRIELAVAASGRVSEARAEPPARGSTALAACLEGEARRLRFPRHPEREVRFALPLSYRRGE